MASPPVTLSTAELEHVTGGFNLGNIGPIAQSLGGLVGGQQGSQIGGQIGGLIQSLLGMFGGGAPGGGAPAPQGGDPSDEMTRR